MLLVVTCKPPRRGVLSTAGGALAGRSSCRLRCSTVIVKMAWLRLDLHTGNNTRRPVSVLLLSDPRVAIASTGAILLPWYCERCMQALCFSTAAVSHLLFMFVAATARMSVPCISTWLISSLLLTCRSHAPAKLTPVGSSRMVTTGRGADELAHSRSRTSSCTDQTYTWQHGACDAVL